MSHRTFFISYFQCTIDDIDDFHRCEDSLSIELGKCFEACGAVSSCIVECSAKYEEALNECPCMEGCPGGCPCPGWDCEAPIINQVCCFQDFESQEILTKIFSVKRKFWTYKNIWVEKSTSSSCHFSQVQAGGVQLLKQCFEQRSKTTCAFCF